MHVTLYIALTVFFCKIWLLQLQWARTKIGKHPFPKYTHTQKKQTITATAKSILTHYLPFQHCLNRASTCLPVPNGHTSWRDMATMLLLILSCMLGASRLPVVGRHTHTHTHTQQGKETLKQDRETEQGAEKNLIDLPHQWHFQLPFRNRIDQIKENSTYSEHN